MAAVKRSAASLEIDLMKKGLRPPSDLEAELQRRQEQFDKGGSLAKRTYDTANDAVQATKQFFKEEKEHWQNELEPFKDWVGKITGDKPEDKP